MQYDFSFVSDDLFTRVLLHIADEQFETPSDAVAYMMQWVGDGDWREHWNNEVLSFIEENCPPRLEFAIEYEQDSPDYWRGAGLAHTEYSDLAVGIGENYYHALEDAIEQAAEQGLLTPNDIAKLEEVRDEWVEDEVVDKPEHVNIYCIVRMRENEAHRRFIAHGPEKT